MPARIRGTLQLDFDGTLAHGDVSTGILARFLSPRWLERVEAASREIVANPESSALIATMTEGFAALTGDAEDYLRYARKNHPARTGLAELIETAEGLGLECHIVSNGFEFYIRDYLRAAGIEDKVEIHSGFTSGEGSLVYLGPGGLPVRSRFKVAWAEHFLAQHDLLIYTGDGSSDLAPAQRASIVFARDSLLSRMPASFPGTLRPFDTLHDVSRGLEALLGER